ncbi:MAG: C40 family peptidase [Leptolyngbyaceae cyanobacterium SL_7_1]|nr:C40 family peptidase [Leptolyngbyaceae cyanobacterium SL_7_1]
MIAIAELQSALAQGKIQEYQCQENLNLYDSPALEQLATQAIAKRHVKIHSNPLTASGDPESALLVSLCEDSYPGWMAIDDLATLVPAAAPYEAIERSPEEIQARLPQVLEYAHQAMDHPNYYLWGGTVPPNYDCSGLVQAAFASAGIWLPRDSYQQEAFVDPISVSALQLGDLVFFGTPERCSHVGIYIGDDRYIHSSGKEQGRNGIGIDRLSLEGDAISQAYYQQFRGAGRVVTSYRPVEPFATRSS